MSRSAFKSVVALLVIAAMVSVATPGHGETKWAEFRPRDAAFAIDMPGEWTLAERKSARAAPGEQPMHMASVKVNGRAHMTVYWAVPADKLAALSTTSILDATREGIVSNGRDRLRSERRVTIDAYPARELIVEAADSKVYAVRYALMNNVMVQAVVAGPPGVEQEVDTTRFLTSLKPIGR